jgi:hypothetical protein
MRLRAGQGTMGGWPDAANTGYTAYAGYTGSLTTYTGPDPIPSSASGTTYEGMRFTGGVTIGSSSSAPSNLTFKGCLFKVTSRSDWVVQCYGTDITFDHCSFEPAAGPPVTLANSFAYAINHVGQGLTVRRCNLWGFGNCIQLGVSSSAHPVLIEDSYFHDAADQAGSTYHHDGVLSNDGGSGIQYVTIRGNKIVSGGNTNAIALQRSTTGYSNITVTGNWCSGFGYTYCVGGNGVGNSNVVFTDNVLSTEIQPVFGELYGWQDGSGNLWRRNRWRVPAGAAYGNPADDGKYWHPDGTRSTTDYTG